MKRKRKIAGPFVMLPLKILDAPAWRAMDPVAPLLWIALRRKLRNDRLNNGKIYLSCRDAATEIGVSKNTIARRFAELEHYGFVRQTAGGCLGSDGRGIAPRYRFTDLAHGTHPATQDYEKWDGSLFPRREWTWKKQNPVPVRGTPRPRVRDIRKASNGGSVCPRVRDIEEAPECPRVRDIEEAPECPRVRDISSLPVGEGMIEGIRGSSSVRAPVKAGGGGSSPPPVASDLVTMVVGMVNAQLGQLRA